MSQISIIIPLYNRGNHISRALQSIISQTVQDFEIIIVDGNSSDDGPSIVRNWDDSRIVFLIQDGTGVSSARNQGVALASSEFIAFLDADDEWEEDHLETLLRLYHMFPEAGLYSTAYYSRISDENLKSYTFFGLPDGPWEGIIPNYFCTAAYGGEPVLTSMAGIEKNFFMEMNGFNPDTGRGEDTDLWARIALRKPVAFSWNGLGIYNISASNRISDRIEPVGEHRFVNYAESLIAKEMIPSDRKKYLKRYLIKKQVEVAGLNMQAGRFDLAVPILFRCCYKNYSDIKFFIWFLFYRLKGKLGEKMKIN